MGRAGSVPRIHEVDHYEELGVSPGATTAEIRDGAAAEYVALVGMVAASDADRAAAAARMARVNAAWTVLGDDARRARYDAALDLPERSSATVRDVGDTFTPFDDDEYVDPRLVDDTPTGTPSMRRELTFLPALLAAAGLGSLVVGFAVGFGPLLGLGLILVVCSGLSFLVVPLIELAKSSRSDRL